MKARPNLDYDDYLRLVVRYLIKRDIRPTKWFYLKAGRKVRFLIKQVHAFIGNDDVSTRVKYLRQSEGLKVHCSFAFLG